MHRTSINAFCENLGKLERKRSVMKLSCLMLQRHPVYDLKNGIKTCNSKKIYGSLLYMEVMCLTLLLRVLIVLSRVIGMVTLPLLLTGLDLADRWVQNHINQFEAKQDVYSWFECAVVISQSFEARLKCIKQLYCGEFSERVQEPTASSSIKSRARAFSEELNLCPQKNYKLLVQVYMAIKVHISKEWIKTSIQGFWKNTRTYEVCVLFSFYVWLQYGDVPTVWWKTLGIVLFADFFFRVARLVASRSIHRILLHIQGKTVKCLYQPSWSSSTNQREDQILKRHIKMFNRLPACKVQGEWGMAVELYAVLSVVYVLQFEWMHIFS